MTTKATEKTIAPEELEKVAERIEQFQSVGKRIPKLDAWDKVYGKTMYIHDIKLPRMLYGKILWSSYPHAKIKKIDTSRAEKLPGVKAVITGYNTPEIKVGFMRDNPVLKRDKVRQYRDEVAAVAAISPEIAEEAVSLIEVEYEELPGVFDPESAMAEGAPLVHEENGSNILKLKWSFNHGDVEEAKSKSLHVVEDRFKLTWVNHCCMGTCGCIAEFHPNGNLTVYSPTQVRFLAQRDFQAALAALGLKDKRVRVVRTAIGGAFGQKLDTYPYEFITILLAYYAQRPVKLVYSREEEFFATPTRQPVIIDIAQGCDGNGRLTFRDVRMILDNGAYTSWGATTPSVMLMPVSSLYKVPNVRFDAKCVYTNNLYSTAMRGYGNPQATFAIESQIDRLAEAAGIDAVEFRLLNANTPGEVTPQNFKVTSCGLRECLETVREKLGWSEKRGKDEGRGVGVASLVHVGGGARIYRSDGCGTIIKLDDFGKATVVTSATDMGQGSETVIAQIVAEELGIGVEDIEIVNYNTDIEHWDAGAHASRTTFVAGNAALHAARKAKLQLLEIAAKMLNEDVENLDVRDRVVYSKTNPEAKMEIGKVLRGAHFTENGRMIVAEHYYDPPNEMLDKGMRGNLSAAYTYGSHGVEVEVDKETGQVRILRYVVAKDVGRTINPLLMEGQLDGGVAMGIGYALTEQVRIDKGKVLNPNFLDYKVLTFADVPEVESVLIETDDPEGPFGAKGIGEPPLVATAPAIANAIYDAIGVRIRELPITPERILMALKDNQEK